MGTPEFSVPALRSVASRCDVVLVCLVPAMLDKVECKLRDELAPGSLVVCARFALPTLPPLISHVGLACVDSVYAYRV